MTDSPSDTPSRMEDDERFITIYSGISGDTQVRHAEAAWIYKELGFARPSIAAPKHSDCEDHCQLKEHKGYDSCSRTGRCEYASSDPEGHREAQASGEHAMTPEAQFEDICDELKVQMVPHLYEAVRVFAARLSAIAASSSCDTPKPEEVEIVAKKYAAMESTKWPHNQEPTDLITYRNIAIYLAQAYLAPSNDEQRYRFLRDFLDPEDYYSKWPRWTVAVESGGTGLVLRGVNLDAEIDKAMASVDGSAKENG